MVAALFLEGCNLTALLLQLTVQGCVTLQTKSRLAEYGTTIETETDPDTLASLNDESRANDPGLEARVLMQLC